MDDTSAQVFDSLTVSFNGYAKFSLCSPVPTISSLRKTIEIVLQ